LKLLKIAVVLIVVAGAAVGGFLWMRSRKNGDGLRFATVKRGDLAVKVSDVGTVEPRLKVEVKSKVAGRITDVLVDEGNWVEKGQTIALVDRTELERNLEQTLADLEGSQARLRVESARRRYGTQVAQAKARLEAARANLENLQAGPRRQEVARAEGEVESARIALRDAESSLAQRLSLLKQGVLRRRQAESDVKAAKAALAQLKAGTRTEEVRSAEAAVQRAEATSEDADNELKRQQQLLEKGFVPQQRADTARTQVKLAAADLKRAREQLGLLKAGSRQEEIDAAQARLDRAEAELAAVQTTNDQEIAGLKTKVELATADVGRAEESLSLLKEGSRAEQIEAAAAQVREAEAALTAAKDGQTEIDLAQEDVTQAEAASRRLEQTRDNVQTQLADTVIQAPMAGTVIDRAIEPGELTTSGVSAFGQGQPIVTIADLSEMRVEARINEVDVARLKVGQTAQVKVDALPDKKLKGIIRQISVHPTNAYFVSLPLLATGRFRPLTSPGRFGYSSRVPDGGSGNAGERPERRSVLYGRQDRVRDPVLFSCARRDPAGSPKRQTQTSKPWRHRCKPSSLTIYPRRLGTHRSGSSRNFPGRRAADVGQRVFSQTEPKSHRDFGVFPTFAGIPRALLGFPANSLPKLAREQAPLGADGVGHCHRRWVGDGEDVPGRGSARQCGEGVRLPRRKHDLCCLRARGEDGAQAPDFSRAHAGRRGGHSSGV